MSDIMSPYKVWPGLKSHPLGEQALALREKYLQETDAAPTRLSPLIAMSDPRRTPDVTSWAKTLPENCAIIYRYDEFDPETAQSLWALSRENNQQLLFRSNSLSPQSEGLHFPRATELSKIKAIHTANPGALLSLAALKTSDYEEALPPLDALLVSAVFPSKSPSAGAPIGVGGIKEKVKRFSAPVYALGGITSETAKQLIEIPLAGIAAVGAFAYKSAPPLNDLIVTKIESGETIQFRAKFETGVDCDNPEVAVLDLRRVSEGLYNAHHTGVPKSMGGKGVGTALVKAMSEDAHKCGYKIIAGCPFVAVWFKRKPEWANMAALTPQDYTA